MIQRRLWLQHGVLALAAPAWARAGTPKAASTIAAQFGTLPPPGEIHKVFAAGAPAGVLVAALAPDKLLGWPIALPAPARALLSPQLTALAHIGRLAGRGSTVSLEALLQLRPDLVLDAGATDATYISGMRRVSVQTGLAAVLIQGRVTEHATQLRDVGQLLGVAARGETLAREAEAALALAAQVRASVPAAQQPRVYYGRGVDGLETGLAGSINTELLELCAGRNVAVGPDSSGLARVSMEQLLTWDPQVIVTQDPAFAQRALTDPLWRSLSAVRTRRVHCAPALPFGWIDGPPGINRLIGVRWLIERLHPTHPALRTQEPLPQAVLRFYRLFYGADLSTAQLRQLLETAA